MRSLECFRQKHAQIIPWLRYRSTCTVYLFTAMVCPAMSVGEFFAACAWYACHCAIAVGRREQPASSWLRDARSELRATTAALLPVVRERIDAHNSMPNHVAIMLRRRRRAPWESGESGRLHRFVDLDCSFPHLHHLQDHTSIAGM